MTKTYGQPRHLTGADFTTSGLVNSDSVSSVSESSTGAGQRQAVVAGSPYAIIASGAAGSGLANYTISYVNGSLTVNPSPSTITANSVTQDLRAGRELARALHSRQVAWSTAIRYRA